MVVAVALSATVCAPCGWSIVLFGGESGRPVTGDGELLGLSGKLSGIQRTPRLVPWVALMQEVGACAEGKVETSNSAGDLIMAPRFVAWILGFLVVEKLMIDKNNLSGGCARVRAPAFVA